MVGKSFSFRDKNITLDDLFLDDTFKNEIKEAKLINNARGSGLLNRFSRPKDVLFKNYLLVGAAASGKNFFANKVAAFAGLDSLEISVKSLLKFQNDQEIKEEILRNLNKIKSRKTGLMVIVDNFEEVYKKYDFIKDIITSFAKQRSNSVMFVFVSRNENTQDIKDLIDITLKFEKPNLQQRKDYINWYLNNYIFSLKSDKAKAALVESFKLTFDQAKIDELAAQLDGLTFGQIEKFMKFVYSKTLLTDNKILTTGIIEQEIVKIIGQKA